VRAPRIHYAAPSLYEERVSKKDQNGSGTNPLPSELDVQEPPFDSVPLIGERTRRKEQDCRSEDPLRQLE
jgi:hypothetical protein